MHSLIIKIADFLKKNIDSRIREVYGPEDLDEQGNLLSFNEQVALITHYAMLRDDYENNQSYKRAIDVLNGWYHWIARNRDTARKFDADMVADGADAFQTYLFNDLWWVLIISFFELFVPPEPFMWNTTHFIYCKFNINLS